MNFLAMGMKGMGRQDDRLAVLLTAIVSERFSPRGAGKPAAGCAIYATESAG